MFAKRMTFVLMVILLAGLLFVACGASEVRQAQNALTEYFAHLHDGEYEEAAALYGGEYDVLQQWNPDVDPLDYATLWERGCTVNGLQCLTIRQVGAYEIVSTDTFEFWVQFEDPNGGAFQIQAQDQAEPESSFRFTVTKAADGYVVKELPVYVE